MVRLLFIVVKLLFIVANLLFIAYMLSFGNANPGDLDVNQRVSEKRGFIHKSEGLRKSWIYSVNRVVSENQGLVCKSEGLRKQNITKIILSMTVTTMFIITNHQQFIYDTKLHYLYIFTNRVV